MAAVAPLTVNGRGGGSMVSGPRLKECGFSEGKSGRTTSIGSRH